MHLHIYAGLFFQDRLLGTVFLGQRVNLYIILQILPNYFPECLYKFLSLLTLSGEHVDKDLSLCQCCR